MYINLREDENSIKCRKRTATPPPRVINGSSLAPFLQLATAILVFKLILVFTIVLPRPPQNLTGIAISPKTIQVMWSSPSNISQMENVTNYYIFYREYNGVIGQWEARGIPTANTSYNITRLKPKTWYKIRMSASVTDGSGPASDEISTQTLEGGKESCFTSIACMFSLVSHLAFLAQGYAQVLAAEILWDYENIKLQDSHSCFSIQKILTVLHNTSMKN